MRRSRRARTVRRPLATRPSPTRARPPTAAPVRGREFGRLSVSPSTWVAGAVVVVAVTPAVSSGDPAAVPATSVPAAAPAAGAGPVDATDSGPPVVEAWAEAGQSLASSVSTPQPVRPVMNGETVTAGGAVVVVVVVVRLAATPAVVVVLPVGVVAAAVVAVAVGVETTGAAGLVGAAVAHAVRVGVRPALRVTGGREAGAVGAVDAVVAGAAGAGRRGGGEQAEGEHGAGAGGSDPGDRGAHPSSPPGRGLR